MTDPATTPESHPPDTAGFMEAAAERAARGPMARPTHQPVPPTPPPPGIAEARRLLDEAWEHSAAGTEVPSDARLRQAKKAVLRAMRPVTLHQVQFNQQVSVAVKELAIAVDALVDRVDEPADPADDANLRVHAALATVEVSVDDLACNVDRLESLVADLTERTSHLEESLTAERAEVRSLRARQDVVLRNAAATIGGKAEKRRLADLSTELDDSAQRSESNLADLTQGSRADVKAALAELVEDVRPWAGSPVTDLVSGRGEWLELLGEAGVEAQGVDPRRRAVQAAGKRGLTVTKADPLVHLAGLPEGSQGVITAMGLADRISHAALLELLDRALIALRPGGLLLLSAANPTALDVGAAELWVDPARRRPLHPRWLELAALDRGFGEAEIRWLQPADETLAVHPDDLVGIAPARAEALAARINQVVAGPRSYAVLARKPGAAVGSSSTA